MKNNEYEQPKPFQPTTEDIERVAKLINSKLTAKRVTSVNGVPVDENGNIKKEATKDVRVVFNPQQFAELSSDYIAQYIRINKNTAIVGNEVGVDRHIVVFTNWNSLRKYTEKHEKPQASTQTPILKQIMSATPQKTEQTVSIKINKY